MVDLSELEDIMERIETFASDEAIPIAAEIVRVEIINRTAQGYDADGQTFTENRPGHPYSPSHERYRANLGYGTRVKNIRMSGALMDALQLRNDDELAVDDGAGGEMPKMVGQMQHPAWSYHHNILGVNEQDRRLVANELNVELSAQIT